MALKLPLRPRAGPLEAHLCASCQQNLTFSTSAAAFRQKQWHRKSVKQQILDTSVGTQKFYGPDGRKAGIVYPEIIPYPYGPNLWYKQSNRGLYGGLSIRSGNNVSEKNEIKTRTKWKPNIQNKALYSQALGKSVKVRVATRVLRTIEKVGGLDEYLLGDKPARIKELGPTGWMLRWRIMRTAAVQERFKQERLALGLPSEGIGELGLVDLLGRPATVEYVQQQVQEVDRQLDEANMFEEDQPQTVHEANVERRMDEESELERRAFMSEKPSIRSVEDQPRART